ncbi:hypothetical protein SAMN04489724_0679 [Algoriphagus locisalis]|uniref:Uncharacterized protein n=1 Tax=Algoriphagus locisalis TaxID=305507 RepID=A0A1I6XVV2_9BACT|nr:hypothetical protein [Algoriphagus locisalis]SFT42092.1 hypothetical protein SAMN04489724_0679 [Algoriphagus locisalis]
MSNNFYPSVSEDFLLDRIRKSPKIDPETEKQVGSSYSFMMRGDRPIYKRQITLRSVNGEFNFMQASSKAILLGFMTELLEYLENEKGYKDGGYISNN